jgi:hypothetical protein
MHPPRPIASIRISEPHVDPISRSKRCSPVNLIGDGEQRQTINTGVVPKSCTFRDDDVNGVKASDRAKFVVGKLLDVQSKDLGATRINALPLEHGEGIIKSLVRVPVTRPLSQAHNLLIGEAIESPSAHSIQKCFGAGMGGRGAKEEEEGEETVELHELSVFD